MTDVREVTAQLAVVTRIAAILGCVLSAQLLAGAGCSPRTASPVPNQPGAETMSEAQRLLDDGDQMFRKREYAEANAVYRQAVDAAESDDSDGARSALVEALAQVARSHLTQDQKDEGQPWLTRAAELAVPSQPLAWSRYLGVRGRFEWKDDDLRAATETFTEMYNYCADHELHDRAVDAAHMIAITSDPEDQIVWGLKGIAEAEAGGLDQWLGPLWNNLGWTYDELGRHDKALEALINAREYHWKGSNELPKLVADYSVGTAYRKTGQLEQADEWLQKTLAWAERRYAEEASPTNSEWIGFTCRELAELAATQGKTDEAIKLFERARVRLEEAKMHEWDADGFKAITTRIEELQR